MNIVWEDDHCLVVNKPSGLLTTSTGDVDSLEKELRKFLSTRGACQPFTGLPHRIDRPVSGAVLVGKTAKATKAFCAQFQSRKIDKTYIAVFNGHPNPPAESWTDWMRKIPDRAAAEIVNENHPDARQARLSFETVNSDETMSVARIELETGRTHQIRLQFASRGFPILGDEQYGSETPFGPQFEDERKRAIALHAWRIEFRHPKTAKAIRVEAPFPSYWLEQPVVSQLIGDRSNGFSFGQEL